MQNINYSAIAKLQELGFAPIGKVLDLGCGTGLVGQAFKMDKNSFIGVDISQKMLDKAALKGVYANLIKADIVDFLQTLKLISLIWHVAIFEYLKRKLYNLYSI